MSWTTIIWSMGSGLCLALAVVNLLVWLKSRDAWANLFFAIATLSAAFASVIELAMMRAHTPQEYGELLCWLHVPSCALVVSLVLFVRFYLHVGRLWLIWLICAIRLLILLLNVLMPPVLNFIEITDLHHFSLWGEMLVVPVGKTNPWSALAEGSGFLLLVFVIDAGIATWRRGDRRQAWAVCGTIGAASVLGVFLSINMDLDFVPLPYTTSMAYLVVVLGLAFELSLDLFRAARISLDLREIQMRMSLAARAANLSLWEWDIIQDEVWVTEAGRARVGARASEPISFDRLLKSIYPDERELFQQEVRRTLEGGAEFRVEYRVVTSDGAPRWIEARGQVDREPDGKPLRVRGVSVDITDRKQNEEALRESEARFRNVADTAPMMIWMSGPDKLCDYFNNSWLDYTGRALEQELGNGWAEGVHPDDFQRCLEIYKTSFDARRAFSMQYRLRKNDGQYGWLLDIGVPRFAADGPFLGYIGSCVDITFQKEAEERIRESAEFNETILASLDSHVAILSRSGRILTVNDAWKEFALTNGGRSPEVGVGVSYLEVCERAAAAGDVTARRVLEGIRSVLEGARQFFEMEYPCSSPAESWSFLMRVVPLKIPGGGAVVSHTDITQLRRVEREAVKLHRDLVHAQRVSAAGQLAATLAHELNQPLGAILRNAEAGELFLSQNPPDYEELQAILADIRRDDQRASAVIDRARSMLKRGDPLFEPLSVKKLLDQVAAMAYGELQARHVTLDIELPAGLPPVKGDLIQLQQVVLNLLVNGMDALNGVPTERRRLGIHVRWADNETVEVAVHDRGHGVPVDKLARMGEPFFTTKTEGLGMGLAISRTIIQAHGGRIWAENNPEGGATVRFTLKVSEGGGTA